MNDEQVRRSLLLVLSHAVPLLYFGQIREWLLLRHPRTARERAQGAHKYRGWKKRCGDQIRRVIEAAVEQGELGRFEKDGNFSHRAIVVPEPLFALGPGETVADIGQLKGAIKAWLDQERNVPYRELQAYYVPSHFQRPALERPFFRQVVEYAERNRRCSLGSIPIEAFRLGSMFVSQFAYRPGDVETFRLSTSPFDDTDKLVVRALVAREGVPTRLYILRNNSLDQLDELAARHVASVDRIEGW